MFNKRSGRQFPVLKLQLIAKPGKTTSELALKHSISQPTISNCIRGTRTSARVNEILLQEWEISVADAREAYKEHKEREILGNPVTFEEAFEWMVRKRFEYRTTHKGLVTTWEEFRKAQYDLVYPMYRAAFAPRVAA
ncbi:hypothetical protein LEP1GSC034_0894 [Leptospira interrogans str. 2003000735]|uniref:Uncharacterized protein n=2 Tax=Leptospira interrogans TaxID=173 RepID=A0A829D4N2_LEPIR|nr:hypothetical protein [Leptospira interrogans]EMY03925.1 hypothetical protein LEP1GSC029_3786 [Leptospira interrogans str. 2002000626]EMY26741.1 hypothetical protein LEP1GSC115_4515 [Leptospira interrogans serovar Australis str. 200703203]EKN86903.1 hypothetical protein LEP1GSC027_2480 [Leptospira interrogans str. 2002000624]EKQ37069.1 hypothetical protein LEP1GSC025_1397 [Leptospira interrogans str. 2002000621]EKQ46610.1 hypothetical protein LEP1GSC026_1120 [Leptospira interrogans str. 2002